MPAVNRLKVDTHVHFHDCFDEDRFLDAAADSLCDSDSDSNADTVYAALCLTESLGTNWFGRLSAMQDREALGKSNWCVRQTHESNSVLVEDGSDRKMAIIAGRQIVCKEGLEVLALGLPDIVEDGNRIRDVLQMVHDKGAIAVLPWGFGKWLGGRGEVVQNLLDDPPCPFLLGDNGGRLALFSEPSLFAQVRKKGLVVLPGTDPFPFAWDGERVGSFGMEWQSGLTLSAPFKDFKTIVDTCGDEGRRFGRLETIPSFFRNQVAIQLRRFTR